VNHLHIVARSSLTNPITARLAIRLGSSFLEYFLNGRPSRRGTTRHKRWAMAGALFTTGDTRANKKQALGLELFGATNRVREMRVSAIDNNIAWFQVLFESCDELINGGTGFYEENDFAGLLELRTKLFNTPCTLNFGTCRNVSTQ
jgi:hypothetical protein